MLCVCHVDIQWIRNPENNVFFNCVALPCLPLGCIHNFIDQSKEICEFMILSLLSCKIMPNNRLILIDCSSLYHFLIAVCNFIKISLIDMQKVFQVYECSRKGRVIVIVIVFFITFCVMSGSESDFNWTFRDIYDKGFKKLSSHWFDGFIHFNTFSWDFSLSVVDRL